MEVGKSGTESIWIVVDDILAEVRASGGWMKVEKVE